MDLGREAGVEVKIMTPFSALLQLSPICEMYLLSQTASSPACHFISNHYGFVAGKSPELGTVTTH